MSAVSRIIVAGACLAGASLAPAAMAQPTHGSQCFLVSQYQDWRDVDARTIYVRVNVRDVYRLDTANACPILTEPNAQLVLNTEGGGSICGAADWDLRVRHGTGGLDPAIPCAVARMTRLSPAEAGALPARERPY